MLLQLHVARENINRINKIYMHRLLSLMHENECNYIGPTLVPAAQITKILSTKLTTLTFVQ